jgi:HPr kinase/phosphorylase
MHTKRRLHGSCITKDGHGILLLGPPGSGKSDLVLRLLARGFTLVADDQVDIDDAIASPPATIAGLLEVRGLGILRLPHQPETRLALVIELGRHIDRLPYPSRHPDLHLPVLSIDPTAPSAPDKIAFALDCALGHIPQVAGAFAA